MEILDTLDTDRAERLLLEKMDMEDEFQSSLRRLTTFVMEDSRNVGHIVDVVLIIKALERMGDHASNIAEHVLYMVKGQDVRHQLDRLRQFSKRRGWHLETQFQDEIPMNDRTRNVLFLCTGNSARSIIAEAILNRVGRPNMKNPVVLPRGSSF